MPNNMYPFQVILTHIKVWKPLSTVQQVFWQSGGE